MVLRSEGFAWAPVSGSFDKLREVGVLSYLIYLLSGKKISDFSADFSPKNRLSVSLEKKMQGNLERRKNRVKIGKIDDFSAKNRKILIFRWLYQA